MSATIFFLLVSCVGFIEMVPIGEDVCPVRLYDTGSSCSGLITVDKLCNESIANLAESTLKTCDAVQLTWSYPMRNLTITIETPYTQQHQDYSIEIDNRNFYESTFHLFRILNGEEISINTPDESVTVKSDSKYQVQLKIVAPYTISLYILNINYKVAKI